MYGRKATVNALVFAEVAEREDKYVNVVLGTKSRPDQYYKMQSCIILGKEGDPFKVYVHFDAMITEEWKREIFQAMKDINTAAPGLNICELKDSEMKDESKRPVIRILQGITEDTKYDCTTIGNVKSCEKQKNHRGFVLVFIGVSCNYDNDDYKKIHSRCELLHALGFEREHQRFDGKRFMNYPKEESVRDDYKRESIYQKYYWPCKDFYGITPFDVFSVMLYEEDESIDYYRKLSKRRVWSAKCNDTAPNVELSELDKLALNLVYPPCRSSNYSPEQSENGMYYCGREVMSHHNRPNPSLAIHDKCQKGGPNCPACRTLSKPKEKDIEIESKWQGWSGFVYCGQPFTSEGEYKTCGIHYGNPCPDCRKIVQGL